MMIQDKREKIVTKNHELLLEAELETAPTHARTIDIVEELVLSDGEVVLPPAVTALSKMIHLGKDVGLVKGEKGW